MSDSPQVRVLPLNRIRRNSNIDPRKGRNKAKYAQLVESITAQGILQPILVRPITDLEHDFEVVAGNSRWSAAQDAGLDSIPAQIRTMSDQEARIAAALENQVRTDLTPIEEAQHAVVLLADIANDHAAVMNALNWSRTKLDSRILLSHACHEVADALLHEQIKIGHAELLCRLPADTQRPVLARIIEMGYSVTETRDRLLSLTRDISTARFDTQDCLSCLHNSGLNADLFEASLGDSRCQNANCWNQKTTALIEATQAEAQQEFGVVHTDLTLPREGYSRLEAKGTHGISSAPVCYANTTVL
ncbi:ParB/RepB/Spo0J family partition protein [Azomonas macrocytogenes]|uniref:PRTRC genetic system ParB family protein n=1 Tax=Azomonas macrocytogenes TaxID=69962 RepID=A0A839T8Q1_AZOMA|nr:ParB/RepB/Spo0J family partition protein [Azomonas macrocytogenes]MBB3105260.1 PRTRC genetic system ParB family protein [Azomonas macrocytogenes]